MNCFVNKNKYLFSDLWNVFMKKVDVFIQVCLNNLKFEEQESFIDMLNSKYVR